MTCHTFLSKASIERSAIHYQKKWLTLLANYANNIFGQHVAILRDVRLAFWDAGDFGGSNVKAEGAGDPQLEYTRTFLPTRSRQGDWHVGQAKRKLLEPKLRAQIPFIFE